MAREESVCSRGKRRGDFEGGGMGRAKGGWGKLAAHYGIVWNEDGSSGMRMGLWVVGDGWKG